MRLLLDTHIALWALMDDPRLTAQARVLIEDEHNRAFISAASLWEIAVKRTLGRGGIPFSAQDALRHFTDANYEFLGVRPSHAVVVETLPHIHSDPFDRMLVSQALTEPMRLLTHDRVVAKYSDLVLLV